MLGLVRPVCNRDVVALRPTCSPSDGSEREQAPEPAGPGACLAPVGKPSCSVVEDAALEDPALEDVLSLDRDQVALGELATSVRCVEQPDGLAHPEALQGV